MTLQTQIKVWVGVIVVTILLLWLFRGILLPFIVGLALAYLLDPFTDKLEKLRLPRSVATLIAVSMVVLIIVGAFLLFVPLLLQQLAGLIERLPSYISQLQTLANDWLPEIRNWLGEERVAQFENNLSDLAQQALGVAGSITGQLMQSGATVINAVGLLVITPVVAFYMLLDWDRMVAAVDKLLPRRYRDDIVHVMKEIDKSMAGVIRGQGTVLLVLSIFYSVSLTVTGLSFGFAIGLTAGLLSFIPYVGFLVGFVLSIGVALVQFWPDWVMIGVIFAIFMVGQFLEGNVLYPKLVGHSIGVHPVWLMFSLFAFAVIFGAVGVLLAVPLSAIAGVLTRFVIQKYKKSSLYHGDQTPVSAAGPPGDSKSVSTKKSSRSESGSAE